MHQNIKKGGFRGIFSNNYDLGPWERGIWSLGFDLRILIWFFGVEEKR